MERGREKMEGNLTTSDPANPRVGRLKTGTKVSLSEFQLCISFQGKLLQGKYEIFCCMVMAGILNFSPARGWRRRIKRQMSGGRGVSAPLFILLVLYGGWQTKSAPCSLLPSLLPSSAKCVVGCAVGFPRAAVEGGRYEAAIFMAICLKRK